ncbi:transglycosylase SLT domain-containing protein [Uliginosibacterium sp. sgz301328]|uniref:lytic transglycosylase domain-containing protein n=1 Tax=Uliginosibacterium sp. sgz301328 TaxID=3243764 RepID=UPI00359E481E
MKSKLCAAVVASVLLAGQAAQADIGDDRITAARDAASKGDIARLATLAAAPSAHVLEPYVTYWWLAARNARATEPIPTDDVRVFLARNEGTWLAEKLRTEWLKRLGKEGQWALFNTEYERVAVPDQELQCYAIQGNGPSAATALQVFSQQWLAIVDMPDSCWPAARQLVSAGQLQAEDIWARFRRQIEAKRLTGAGMTAALLPVGQAPDSTQLSRAYGDPVKFLISPAARNTSTRASRETTIAALTQLARSGDVSVAFARWQALPTSDFRKEERAYVYGQLGWRASATLQPDALSYFAEAHGTPMSDEQMNWYARAALRVGDWKSLLAIIDSMPANLQALPEWTYWKGRALQAQGRTQDAQTYYQRFAGQASFYGILSAEALGASFAWPQPTTPPTQQEMTLAQAVPDFQRALALTRLDMRTEAAREWNWAIRGADDRTLLAAAEYARRQGLYDRAINTAERTRDQHDFSLRYLAPYYETFAPYARNNSLDLAWVYGLVRQESRFLSVARSGVGAQGLMQVMPATGKWMADKLGVKGYSLSWLQQIDGNVLIGTAYLRRVLDGLGNSRVLATAAYNAGPGRARKWRANNAMEGAIYVETIPFSETRDYVKKVMANAEIYATLFDKRPASLLSRLGTITPDGVNDALVNATP